MLGGFIFTELFFDVQGQEAIKQSCSGSDSRDEVVEGERGDGIGITAKYDAG